MALYFGIRRRMMKEKFLLDPSIVFLNHGSFGACPAEVFEVYQSWQREMEKNPVEFLGRRSAELLHASRSVLADYVGTQPEALIYVPNATTAVNTIARSLPLRAGDQILTSDQEYGACNHAWEFVCRQTGAQYLTRQIPLPFQAGGFADRLWEGVTARTRIIYLSHITSTTGILFPVEDVCHRARAAGICTVIDGAHAPGQIPLHLETLGADFYVGNCHKWLCAPKGSAFLYADPRWQERIDALVVSWGYSCRVEGHTGFDAYTGATLFERRHQWQGTRDISAFLSVPAAIRFQHRHQWDRWRHSCHRLAIQTKDRICALTGLTPICADSDFVQMTAIPIHCEDPEALKDTLFHRYHIEIPVTSHRDRFFLRLCLQAYNTEQDTDRLVQAVREICP